MEVFKVSTEASALQHGFAQGLLIVIPLGISAVYTQSTPDSTIFPLLSGITPLIDFIGVPAKDA